MRIRLLSHQYVITFLERGIGTERISDLSLPSNVEGTLELDRYQFVDLLQVDL